jgi:hypothetical protein
VGDAIWCKKSRIYSLTLFFFSSISDATSSGEAANLQNRLRTLSSGLAGLRSSLHGDGDVDNANNPHQQSNNQPNYCNVNGSPPPPPPQQTTATSSSFASHQQQHQQQNSTLANSSVGMIAPISSNPPAGFQVGELF